VTHLLIALAVAAGYVVFLLARPHRKCRRCGGWGSRGKRRAACPKCGGTGTRFRAGAPLVHRGAAAAIRYIRERMEGRE
jgi:DnaJ-class molecular chaperone